MEEEKKTKEEKLDDRIMQEVMEEIRELECLSNQWK
jgi:hypothetical protein